MSDAAGVLRATDDWFGRHGLTYFVPEERAAVRRALRPRRTALPLVAGFLVAACLGGLLGWATGDAGTGVALLLTILGLGVGWYALTALRFRRILTWALGRTFGSLARLLPMVLRALPLLLVFATFLFINADVWQMASRLSAGVLWLTGLLFGVSAVAFLLVRLPEEVDRIDDDVDAAFLTRACAGTPLERPCREILDQWEAGEGADPAAYATIAGFERWNLVLALLIIQAVQALLIAVAIFAFFVIFGGLVMSDSVQLAWTGQDSLHSASWLPSVSAELVRVSVFLAAFSLLYVTVSTVTDETYRAQFFGTVLRELERAVGMRAVYLAVRDREGRAGAP